MSEFMRTITADMLCKVPNILEFGWLLPFPTSILSRGFIFLRMFNKTCKGDLQQSPFQPVTSLQWKSFSQKKETYCN